MADLMALLAAKKAAKAEAAAQATTRAEIIKHLHEVAHPPVVEAVVPAVVEEVAEPVVEEPAEVEIAPFPAEAKAPIKPESFHERVARIRAEAEAAGKPLPKVEIKAPKNPTPSDLRIPANRAEVEAKLTQQKEAAEAAAKLRHTPKLVPQMQKHIGNEVKKLSLAEKLAMKRLGQEEARKAVEEMELASEPPEVLPDHLADTDPNAVVEGIADELVDEEEDTSAFNLNIVLNERQLMAKEMALAGKNFALIGAAGTGKTTTQRSVAKTLVQDKRLRTVSYKLVGGAPGARVNAPSIAFVAYTRRASANLQRAIHKDPELEAILKHNIMTIHALLEFEPETFWDDEKQKESFRFIPRRNASNPLEITHLVIEEASMLGLDLWEQLFDALPHGVQIIFIGDINQLPPVFGASILNYALVQLPIIELLDVYRNAGIVLASAHNVLAGKPLIEGESHDDEGRLTGKVSVVRGKSPVQVGQGKMAMSLGKMFEMWYDAGYYNPDTCMILSPWNKNDLGTDNMNNWIAQFLGTKRKAVVWEVISGFNKLYLAVGDRVMYNKQDAVITDIKFNGMYHGKEPQPCGADLSRFGVRILGVDAVADIALEDQLLSYSNFSVDELEETAMERKQQASHVVTIQTETGQKLDLTAAGDFGPQVFSLGYVLTVHKAQGCEWEKVFVILHKDHAVSLYRELFYTALTRARLEAIIIAKDSVIEKAIGNQRIKGNTLQDKVEFFNSGALDIGAVSCVK